jgi:hypothetical protein
MHDPDFLTEFSIVSFVSRGVNEISPSNKDPNWKQKIDEWKGMSDTEQQVWIDQMVVWLDDYKQKFPTHYITLTTNWAPVVW